ncbi:MAG: hypothetical protein QW714_01745 [Nanopusillaceae archaeon]
MRYQEQIISYVLLGAVIVGIAIAVYSYVVPMIQKSHVRNLVVYLEKNVNNLADAISSTGLRYGRTSFELEVSNAFLEIRHNLIRLKLNTPLQYYSSFVKVPINYNEISICYNYSFPIITGVNYSICFDNSMLNLLFLNNGNMIIYDNLANNSLILPVGNNINVITSLFVFDINYNGTHVIFIPKYPVGLYGYSPACIANAYQTATDLYYEITCRPLVDLYNKLCYWVIISPYLRSSTTIDRKTSLTINYDSYYDEKYNSTVCDTVRIINLQISIVS